MKKLILLTFIGVSIILSGCSNSNSQPKLKSMSEIEKLTKEQFIEETAAIYNHVFEQMNKLLDKHKTIDLSFDKEIDKLHRRSVEQMIEYGKVLAKKDEETKSDYVTSSLMAMWDAMEEKGTEASDDFEEKFDMRMPELEAYGSESVGRKLNDLFGIMDFMDFENAKEMHPQTAKEFGIE
ncbi:MAG: hypothetical protein GX921_06665 [Bacteroidales bacterium]|nr:hypothetical protein [Bacteroidales bacterium]